LNAQPGACFDQNSLEIPPPIVKISKSSAKNLRLGEKKASAQAKEQQITLTTLNTVSLNYGTNQLSASQAAIQEALKKNVEVQKSQRSSPFS